MAGPSDLDKQIGAVRDSMESSIVVLRDRGKRQLKRAEKLALIGLGTGAAVGVVVLGIIVIRRLRRPPTRRERLERVIPLGWWDRVWDRVRTGYTEHVPPMRLYIGDRQVGEEPKAPSWERAAVTTARTFGSAAGSAIAMRLLSTFADRMRERTGTPSA